MQRIEKETLPHAQCVLPVEIEIKNDTGQPAANCECVSALIPSLGELWPEHATDIPSSEIQYMQNGIIQIIYNTGDKEIGLIARELDDRLYFYIIDDIKAGKNVFSVGDRVVFDAKRSETGIQARNVRPRSNPDVNKDPRQYIQVRKTDDGRN